VDHNKKLMGGGLLARNTVLNFIGLSAPILVAIISIPKMVSGLGTERFGILTIAWGIIGYFGIIDFGLGRALTHRVAEYIGKGLDEEIPTLVWTSMFLILIMGLFGAVLMFFIAPWIVKDLLKITKDLQNEILVSFYLLGALIPIVIVTTGLRGILEAKQRFDLLTAGRIPMGLVTYAGPLLALPFSISFIPIVVIFLVGRFFVLLIHLAMCLHVIPALRHGISVNMSIVQSMLRFGGWLTVTGIVNPIMIYMDRFVIGSLISLTAVSYFATPLEVVNKVAIIPASLVAVLFPAFTTSLEIDPNFTTLWFKRGIKFIFISTFPIIITIITFAHEGLYFWLGTDFAKNSTVVLQSLALAFFFNCLAQIPFIFLQSVGRPDLPAKLLLIELPIYIVLMLVLIRRFGIEGAAIAGLGRYMLDTTFLFYIANRYVKISIFHDRRYPKIIIGTIIFIIISFLPFVPLLKFAILFVTLSLFILVSWRCMLTGEERTLIGDISNKYIKRVF